MSFSLKREEGLILLLIVYLFIGNREEHLMELIAVVIILWLLVVNGEGCEKPCPLPVEC